MHDSLTGLLTGRPRSLSTSRLPLRGLCLGCGGPAPLTVDRPLHLEDHVDDATIVGSEVPADVPAAVEWRFDESQPEWKVFVPVVSRLPSRKPLQAARTEDALRLSLTEATRFVTQWGLSGVSGYIYVDLPDWQRDDWAYVIVRARTSAENPSIALRFNVRDAPFRFFG